MRTEQQIREKIEKHRAEEQRINDELDKLGADLEANPEISLLRFAVIEKVADKLAIRKVITLMRLESLLWTLGEIEEMNEINENE